MINNLIDRVQGVHHAVMENNIAEQKTVEMVIERVLNVLKKIQESYKEYNQELERARAILSPEDFESLMKEMDLQEELG